MTRTTTIGLERFYFMENQVEVWKVIEEYPDYEISDMGNVKSFKRNRIKILNPCINSRGYLLIKLFKDNIGKHNLVHQLVAIAFLGHTPCGMELVVNHKNFIKTDNRKLNLEIVTQRENGNKKHITTSSLFTGVTWHNKTRKWQSQININGKQTYLGLFKTEIEASLCYEKALEKLINKQL